MEVILFIIVLIAVWYSFYKRNPAKAHPQPLVGFVAGIFFTISGLMAIETGGYGSSLFLLVYSSPFGIYRPITIIGSVLLWTLLGSLAIGIKHRSIRTLLLGILALHFFSIPALLETSDDVWGMVRIKEAFRSGGTMLILSVPLYLCFHGFLLVQIIRCNSRKELSANKNVDHISGSQ